MPPLASRAPGQEYPGIPPELMIAVMALFIAFLVVIICFCLPANKTSCPSASGRCQCGPESRRACHPVAGHDRPPTRPGLALPTASIPRCLARKGAPRAVDKVSRVSQESIRSPATPSPYYGRRAPTGVLPAAQALPRRSAFSTPSSPATSTTPRAPPLGYPTRGPTATVRPVVW